MKAWRMKKQCEDCPFAASGPGAHLRKTLRPGRIDAIKQALRDGQFFPCHQGLSDEIDDETGDAILAVTLVCAGALRWQERNGYSSAYVRLCRAIEAKERAKQRRKRHVGDEHRARGGDRPRTQLRRRTATNLPKA